MYNENLLVIYIDHSMNYIEIEFCYWNLHITFSSLFIWKKNDFLKWMKRNLLRHHFFAKNFQNTYTWCTKRRKLWIYQFLLRNFSCLFNSSNCKKIYFSLLVDDNQNGEVIFFPSDLIFFFSISSNHFPILNDIKITGGVIYLSLS